MASWIGVDVGGKHKGFDAAVIDHQQVLALCGHLTCGDVVDLVLANAPAMVAIDSPRSYAPAGQSARDEEREIARSICGIRWTPDAGRVHGSPYYGWIVEGLALFAALSERGIQAIEVFPTASWTRWNGKRGKQSRAAWSRQGLASLNLGALPLRTNQDGRDAIAAAVTARQHTLGKTQTFGDIVVPADPMGTSA